VGERKQGAVVSRSYDPAPDYCTQALKLLLKMPVNEGRPTTSGPDSAKGGSENVSSAKKRVP
jgi:hypothetical protein